MSCPPWNDWAEGDAYRGFEDLRWRRYRHWIALTRFQVRRRLAREVRDKLLGYFPGQVLATPVREAVALAESPSYDKSIFEYRPRSSAAQDSAQLAEDFLLERTLP